MTYCANAIEAFFNFLKKVNFLDIFDTWLFYFFMFWTF